MKDSARKAMYAKKTPTNPYYVPDATRESMQEIEQHENEMEELHKSGYFDPPKPMTCMRCNKVFPNAGTLNAHMSDKHPINKFKVGTEFKDGSIKEKIIFAKSIGSAQEKFNNSLNKYQKKNFTGRSWDGGMLVLPKGWKRVESEYI